MSITPTVPFYVVQAKMLQPASPGATLVDRDQLLSSLSLGLQQTTNRYQIGSGPGMRDDYNPPASDLLFAYGRTRFMEHRRAFDKTNTAAGLDTLWEKVTKEIKQFFNDLSSQRHVILRDALAQVEGRFFGALESHRDFVQYSLEIASLSAGQDFSFLATEDVTGSSGKEEEEDSERRDREEDLIRKMKKVVEEVEPETITDFVRSLTNYSTLEKTLERVFFAGEQNRLASLYPGIDSALGDTAVIEQADLEKLLGTQSTTRPSIQSSIDSPTYRKHINSNCKHPYLRWRDQQQQKLSIKAI